ncbi:hypothetical protein ACFL17_07180 [Pseudomonadota bacterium]
MSDYGHLEEELSRVEGLALDSPSQDVFDDLEKLVKKQQNQINNLINRISTAEDHIIILVECLVGVSVDLHPKLTH